MVLVWAVVFGLFVFVTAISAREEFEALLHGRSEEEVFDDSRVVPPRSRRRRLAAAAREV